MDLGQVNVGTWVAGLLGALLGALGKWLLDYINARQLRWHERQMRLLDSAVDSAVRFLSAAERTTRACQNYEMAALSLEGAKGQEDEQTFQHFRNLWEEARRRQPEASLEAEELLPSLYLLVPTAGDVAHAYLDACRQARGYQDTGRDERQRLRRETEEAIRAAVGGRRIDLAK
jgi:hypothetical protein